MSKVSRSSMGMSARRKSGWSLWTIFTASSSTVRFRSPRKSIFSRPSSSRVTMVYWHTMDSSFRARGTYSYTGRLVMTTPAAWVEAWRGIPSRARAVSMSLWTLGSPWYRSDSCLDSFRASSRVIWGPVGTSLATVSVSAYVMFSTRPTSRIAARAAMVPKVTIWATWSSPYLRRT